MEKSLDTVCDNIQDELLAARCESRTPSPDSTSHLETCDACREAHKQLLGASPEALAFLVLMHGLTPAPAETPPQKADIKPDKKFEEYLATEVAKLPDENRKPTVIRLARLSFYGLASKLLYPEYETMPPDLDPPNDGYVHPLYHEIDVDAADEIEGRFTDANFDRFARYRQIIY